jgi:hypothetical protein
MQWEYKEVKGFSSMMEEKLNELGEDEWELVTVDFARQDNQFDIFYFKRPLEYDDDEDSEDE